jgi:hypothetical protein
MWGNLEKAIEGFQSFRISPELKQRLAEEKTPGRVPRLASQTLFSPLAGRFSLPAFQQHFALTGYLGLRFLLLTSTPGQGRPQQTDAQHRRDERMAKGAYASIPSGQYCDNTAQ